MMHSNPQLRPTSGAILELISRRTLRGSQQTQEEECSIKTTVSSLSILKSLIENMTGRVEEDIFPQIIDLLTRKSTILPSSGKDDNPMK